MLEARRAAALNRHGWNVAVLDSRGYGQSGGAFPTFGGHEAGDIAAWLEFLSRTNRPIDPDVPFQPVLWGRSMGAAIALRTAAAEPALAALVLESPMVDLDVSMALVLRRRKIPFPNAHGPARHAPGRQAGGRADSLPPPHRLGPPGDLSHLDPARNQRHGRLDRRSTPSCRRLPAAPRWIEVTDARHTDVVDKGGEELLDRIATFLDGAATAGRQRDKNVMRALMD